ncbi:MAG: hypothetical protein ACJ76F_05875, partial [Bacteroidia bacterium]
MRSQYIVYVILLVLGCKKDEQISNSSSQASIEVSYGLPSNWNGSASAYFTVSRNTDVSSADTITYDSYASVDIDIASINDNPGVVKLNGSVLKKDIDTSNLYVSYIDTF